MISQPYLTLVVPTLGRSPWLGESLRALRREAGMLADRPGGVELLLVVPAGSDAGAAHRHLPDRVVEVEATGFAAANNAAFVASRGRYWGTVNDDAVVAEGWAARLCHALDQDRDLGSVQGVHLRLEDRPVGPDAFAELGSSIGDLEAARPGVARPGVDGLGIAWNEDWQAIQRRHGQPFEGAESGEIFGVSATAALYRRSAIEPDLPFDERLWAYYEDVDLAWRLASRGWRARLVADAGAWHAGSATGRTLAFGGRQLIHGNRHLVLARHLGRQYWRRWPRIVARDARDLARLAISGDAAGALGVVAGLGRAALRLPAYAHLGRPELSTLARFGMPTAAAASSSASPSASSLASSSTVLSPVPVAADAPAEGDSPALPLAQLGAVVVHWRNEEEVHALATAWARQTDGQSPMVIVDNSSSLDALGLALASASASASRVVDPGRNLGFGGGVDRGVAELEQNSPQVRWVLVLNPDVVPLPGAVDQLRRACVQHADAAGLVPALEHADGRSQCRWQLQPLPSVRHLLLQAAFWGRPRGPACEPAAGAAIEQPAAAALLLRVDVLAAVGGFGDAYFPAWFEDVDLATRLRRAGATLRFVPRARFVHAMGGSVPSLGYGRFLWLYYRHLVRYLERHHGAFWAGLARALLPVSAGLRALLLPLRRPRRARSRRHALVGLRDVAIGAGSDFRRPRHLADQFSADQFSADQFSAVQFSTVAGEPEGRIDSRARTGSAEIREPGTARKPESAGTR